MTKTEQAASEKALKFMMKVLDDPKSSYAAREKMAFGIARHLSGLKASSHASVQIQKKKLLAAQPKPIKEPKSKKAAAALDSERSINGDSKWASLIKPVGGNRNAQA